MSEVQNIGFNIEKEIADSSPEDYVLGTTEPLTGVGDPVKGLVGALYAWPNPIDGVYPRVMHQINHAIDFINKKSKEYLPDGTVQRGTRDWMNCATNAPHNEREKQFNYIIAKGLLTDNFIAWLKEKGYINPNNGKFESSDAFNSILSGTTREGNSLKAPLESIRNDGIIPKSMLPDIKSFNWEQYHNPDRITQEMKDLGKEFLKYVELKYEKVLFYRFDKFLDIKWEIFDSYTDKVDGDFIKRLAPDYNIMGYGYHLTINQVNEPKKENEETMEFYKASKNIHPFRIYQLGDDSKYHWWKDEKLFIELWGDFSNITIIDKVTILENEIGSIIYDKQSLIDMVINLFKGKK